MAGPGAQNRAEAPESLPPLLLIGHGRMGGAMMQGWRARGIARSVIIDPEMGACDAPHVVFPSLEAFAEGPDARRFAPEAVVLAVKPQVSRAVTEQLAGRFGPALLVSIMAGRTTASLERETGFERVVRAMPNLPASIGQGITGAFACRAVETAGRALADRILSAVGTVVWLDAEEQLDAVTAVSGSGPAYVFLLAELLEAAGIRQGLPQEVAARLARQTVVGAGALLGGSETPARAMREAVTSKGGTTERALEVLGARDAWPRLVDEAVHAAAARSRALAS